MHPATLSFLVEYGFRSGLLLLLTYLAARLLKSRSSSWLHLLWFVGLMSLLVLPAAEIVTPKWSSDVLVIAAPLRTVVNVVASSDSAAPVGTHPRPLDWLWIVWICGAGMILVRFAVSMALAARLSAQAEPWREEGCRISRKTNIPMVCGLFRPVIVLPEEARNWPEARLQSVLRHERMHVTRWDIGTQALAQLACALYWPQPLVWLAAKQLRKQCEHACDDGVLVTGTKASVYAEDLLKIAEGLRERTPAAAALAGGIAMTRTHHLEDRISALLSPNKDRRSAGAGFAASVTGLALTMVVLIAAVRTPLFAQQGKIAGVIRDASGALVQGARVDLIDHDPKVRYHEIVMTNDAGEFAFDSVPDSGYDISVSKAGFAKLQQNGIKYEAGRPVRLDMTLNVGVIQERLTVSGGETFSIVRDTDAVKQKLEAELRAKNVSIQGESPRLQIGGNVQAAKLDRKVNPAYPPTAKADRVQGTVLLSAVIGKDGFVLNLEQVNKQVDDRLVQSAMDAVKQWHYQPTLLNGNPVEIVTQIEINFTLMK